MPRKPRSSAKPAKPPLAAICATFTAGHKVRLTASGPIRERVAFSAPFLQKALSAIGVRVRPTEVLAWMRDRGLVDQAGSSYTLTPKGAHVSDRACTVFARRLR